jgi:hypothetical protein
MTVTLWKKHGGDEVLFNTPSVVQLATIIGQTIVPAFLLGAMASFLSVLTGRLGRIADRLILVGTLDDLNPTNAKLKRHIPTLQRRAALIHRAISFTIFSAICIASMVILSFGSVLANFSHERGVAALFIIALTALIVALIDFMRETILARHEISDL